MSASGVENANPQELYCIAGLQGLRCKRCDMRCSLVWLSVAHRTIEHLCVQHACQAERAPL